MSRASEFRHKYGVFGAGAVSKSLIGRLPRKAQEIGAVSAVSYRLASRIANSLRAGHPVRSFFDLESASTILLYAPPDQLEASLRLLEKAPFHWSEKALVFCGMDPPPAMLDGLRDRGASLAILREFGLAGRIAIEGAGPALAVAHRMARELRLKPVELNVGSGTEFDVALTLASCVLTPLIDRAAALFRKAGVRETEAGKLASGLFSQTAREFEHSGRQSWAWYLQKPDSQRLQDQLRDCESALAPLFEALLLFGFDLFGKHQDVAETLRSHSAIQRRKATASKS